MFLSLILIVITSVLTVIYCLFKINFSYWSRHPQIPSVKGRILSGNFKDFITFKTNFFFHVKTIYEYKRFEKEAVVGIYGLYKPALLIREPELLKSIFIKDFDLFRNRSCEIGDYDLLGSLNIFFAKYPYWKEMRSKLVPVFSSGKLKYMYPTIQKVGENVESFLNRQPDKFDDELMDLCGRYTIDVLSATILGTTCNAVENPQEFIYKEVLKLVDFDLRRALQVFIVFFAPKLNAIIRPKAFYDSTEKFMRESIRHIIAEREKSGIARNDLIDAFIKIKKEAETKGEDITYCLEGIVAQACILVTAAFDASARSAGLALLELAKYEEIQQRLRDEILQAALKENGNISYESINKLEYLQMVIDETLRMYPALPMVERMHEFHPNKPSGFNLKPYYDYDLPNEMPVYVSVFAIHYDAKYWPNPTKFDPERFSPENKKNLLPMTYMPFGEGPHMCIGSRMGVLMIKVALVNMLKNYCVRVCDKTITEPKFETRAVMLQTKDPVHVQFNRDNLYLQAVSKLKET